MREKYLGSFWRGPTSTKAAFNRKIKRAKKRKVKNDSFYHTREWLEIRYAVLKNANGCCALCGNKASPGNPLHVDHIKPRSTHRHLQFSMSNLQVLCRACNIGKSNLDVTDWR